MIAIRPRRSVLYMPGSNARAIVSLAMPVPVSDTQMQTYCPRRTSRLRAA